MQLFQFGMLGALRALAVPVINPVAASDTYGTSGTIANIRYHPEAP